MHAPSVLCFLAFFTPMKKQGGSSANKASLSKEGGKSETTAGSWFGIMGSKVSLS